jgi:hypothetical protein
MNREGDRKRGKEKRRNRRELERKTERYLNQKV